MSNQFMIINGIRVTAEKHYNVSTGTYITTPRYYPKKLTEQTETLPITPLLVTLNGLPIPATIAAVNNFFQFLGNYPNISVSWATESGVQTDVTAETFTPSTFGPGTLTFSTPGVPSVSVPTIILQTLPPPPPPPPPTFDLQIKGVDRMFLEAVSTNPRPPIVTWTVTYANGEVYTEINPNVDGRFIQRPNANFPDRKGPVTVTLCYNYASGTQCTTKTDVLGITPPPIDPEFEKPVVLKTSIAFGISNPTYNIGPEVYRQGADAISYWNNGATVYFPIFVNVASGKKANFTIETESGQVTVFARIGSGPETEVTPTGSTFPAPAVFSIDAPTYGYNFVSARAVMGVGLSPKVQIKHNVLTSNTLQFYQPGLFYQGPTNGVTVTFGTFQWTDPTNPGGPCTLTFTGDPKIVAVYIQSAGYVNIAKTVNGPFTSLYGSTQGDAKQATMFVSEDLYTQTGNVITFHLKTTAVAQMNVAGVYVVKY